METLFRWVHLSDVHFGHGDAAHGHDQKLVLSSLRADLTALRARDKGPIDALLVTGDVAFSGNGRRDTEYTDARATLLALGTELGLGAERIFLVPGNHDVNRAIDRDRAVQRLVAGLRDGQDKLDNALADKGDRATLARRMSAYLDFSGGFAPACLAPAPKPPEERLYWSHALTTTRGLRVRLVGLNTSLLAADDQDHGKLQLGKEQLVQALFDPPLDLGKELVLVLTHHPLRAGWLSDEKQAAAWIRNNAHLHLSGHVHEADAEQTRSGAGGSFIWVTAGAAHGDAEPAGVAPAHGYSVGAVVRAGGAAKAWIWPRKWSPRNVTFRVDQDNVPEGKDHAEHDLPRLTLPAGSGLATSAGEPVSIFFSHAPEDEALALRLEKHLSLLRKKGAIVGATRRTIDAGGDWKGKVDEHLGAAKIILLLISPDYLFSDYCTDTEMEIARQRLEAGEARVIPILLKPSEFSNVADTSNNQRDKEPAWFEKLTPLPPLKNAKSLAVTEWPDVDEAMTAIVKEIRLLVEKLRGAGP